LLLASCGEEKTVESEEAIQERAELGDAEAQNTLGSMYYKGLGVPQDFAKAMKWYRMAAEQGDDVAQALQAKRIQQAVMPRLDLQKQIYCSIFSRMNCCGFPRFGKI